VPPRSRAQAPLGAAPSVPPLKPCNTFRSTCRPWSLAGSARRPRNTFSKGYRSFQIPRRTSLLRRHCLRCRTRNRPGREALLGSGEALQNGSRSMGHPFAWVATVRRRCHSPPRSPAAAIPCTIVGRRAIEIASTVDHQAAFGSCTVTLCIALKDVTTPFWKSTSQPKTFRRWFPPFRKKNAKR
jgi:hypothetical protein